MERRNTPSTVTSSPLPGQNKGACFVRSHHEGQPRARHRRLRYRHCYAAYNAQGRRAHCRGPNVSLALSSGRDTSGVIRQWARCSAWRIALCDTLPGRGLNAAFDRSGGEAAHRPRSATGAARRRFSSVTRCSRDLDSPRPSRVLRYARCSFLLAQPCADDTPVFRVLFATAFRRGIPGHGTMHHFLSAVRMRMPWVHRGAL